MASGGKERVNNEEIIAQFEDARAKVQRFGPLYAQVKWKVRLQHIPSYQYRTAADWRLAGPPLKDFSQSPAGYDFLKDIVGINLTDVRGEAVKVHSKDRDPFTILAAFYVAHEGLVHANTKS